MTTVHFPEGTNGEAFDGEEDDHCRDGWDNHRYGDYMGGPTSCTDVDGGGECYHCECCCSCLGCEYGDRNSPPMNPGQLTPMADR